MERKLGLRCPEQHNKPTLERYRRVALSMALREQGFVEVKRGRVSTPLTE